MRCERQAGFLPRSLAWRDLERVHRRAWLDRSAGMPRPISDVRDGGVARSARTRRSVTRGRLEIRRSWNGIDGVGNVIQYRVESVRHDTSPSCRDRSRQGPACPEDNRAVLLSRMSAQCTGRPLDFATLRAGVVCDVSLVRLARGGKIPLGDIQTKIYHSHIAMGFEPTLLVEASPTCTPPPICTLAPFPKPRWSEDRGRR